MPEQRAEKRWFVNIAAFIFFTILVLTGFTNWLWLPRGYEAKGEALVFIRHALRTIHEWTALAFVLVILVHLALHWAYIKANLKKSGILKANRKEQLRFPP